MRNGSCDGGDKGQRAEGDILSLPSRVSGMKYSSLELIQAQTQPQNLLLGLRISLALGKDGSLRKRKVYLLDWTSLKDHCGPRSHWRPYW